ncbi:hypothetical protein [Paenibacillus sp. B2(2019)]|uniref:hypothetical protein n=1 Tax=Paenibacillus sp. B2(2019) TaxID=2607754 RepID=UPI0021D18F69|nr:hypothetical protein [Paenibacillus sp. B2(2019)]
MEPAVAIAWIEFIRNEVTVSEACTWLGMQERLTTAGKQLWGQNIQTKWWKNSGSFASVINSATGIGKSRRSFG